MTAVSISCPLLSAKEVQPFVPACCLVSKEMCHVLISLMQNLSPLHPLAGYCYTYIHTHCIRNNLSIALACVMASNFLDGPSSCVELLCTSLHKVFSWCLQNIMLRTITSPPPGKPLLMASSPPSTSLSPLASPPPPPLPCVLPNPGERSTLPHTGLVSSAHSMSNLVRQPCEHCMHILPRRFVGAWYWSSVRLLGLWQFAETAMVYLSPCSGYVRPAPHFHPVWQRSYCQLAGCSGGNYD